MPGDQYKFHMAIQDFQSARQRAAVANQLECFAFMARAHEKPERAARLFGAAEALRELINIDMSQMERVEYEREVNDLKANMDEKAFASSWKEGWSMTMEQAIEFALHE